MKFYEEYKDHRGKFEILAFHDTKAKTFEELDPKLQALEQGAWNGKKLPFPILLDASGQTLAAYKVRGFPTLVLIDPEGKIARVQLGSGPDIENFLAGKIKSMPDNTDADVDAIELEARDKLAQAHELRAQAKYREALELYDRIGLEYAGRPTAKLANEAARALRENEEVRKALEQPSKDKPKSEAGEKAANWLKVARQFAKEGKYDLARSYYNKIIAAYPDSKEAETAQIELEKLPKK